MQQNSELRAQLVHAQEKLGEARAAAARTAVRDAATVDVRIFGCLHALNSVVVCARGAF